MRLAMKGDDFSVGQLILSVRVVLLVLCCSLTLADPARRDASTLVVLALFVVVALSATAPMSQPTLFRAQPVAEAVAVCLLMVLLEPLPESLLPYLIAPALAAGLRSGFATGVTASGLAALTLLLGRLVDQSDAQSTSDYLGIVSQWGLITLAVGLLGGWIHRLQTAAEPAENAAYASAYRLISQLRMVSRQLSGGLDPVTLSAALLEQLRGMVPFDRGGVYVRASGGRLSPLAAYGTDRLAWDVTNPLFDEAWASSSPVRQSQPLSPEGVGCAAAIPLQIGLRTFGLVAIERLEPFEMADLQQATTLLEEQGLRLETALLFSEVRTLATAEERRRLAREIHDGIAQELASLGYVVDDLAARARYLPDLERDLRALRGELTRVITELRLSIFDLRSDVQTTIGLGTALSDYVRQVGVASNFTVHIVLDEAPTRLPVNAETELLRIAQEAITNARKHANAENLWVTCSVDPPRATLRIEDDGGGLGKARTDSFGLEVMRERAERVGARLTVQNREHGGTSVEVTLGARHDR
jgi:signal transduction histidine kinase